MIHALVIVGVRAGKKMHKMVARNAISAFVCSTAARVSVLTGFKRALTAAAAAIIDLYPVGNDFCCTKTNSPVQTVISARHFPPMDVLCIFERLCSGPRAEHSLGVPLRITMTTTAATVRPAGLFANLHLTHRRRRRRNCFA